MTLSLLTRAGMRFPSLIIMMLAISPAFAADAPASAAPAAGDNRAGTDDAQTIVSDSPMQMETEDGGAHGELVVSQDIFTPGTRTDLVYTITEEPAHGRVGLAGEDAGGDFFTNKQSRLGYFAYRADEAYGGEDSFSYTVRNITTGLVFKNTVVLTVKPPEPVELPKYEVTAARERHMDVRAVLLTTHPNTPVVQRLPSHQDFMKAEDRASIENPKIAYVLDDKARPHNGSATLERATGQLTYAPNPGFIGEDQLKYYTVDENNPDLGVDNIVTIQVEPVRIARHVTADRTKSREVDLVFVINNSPSMAAHQQRIASSLSRFRELFHTRDLDYRIAVLTTDFQSSDFRRSGDQPYFKEVRSVQIDKAGHPVLDRNKRPKPVTKRVASNGDLVTLPVMDQPWITPQTPDGIFAELVKVGTNGNSNRTAFTSVYNFVAGEYNGRHKFLRPDATTIVVLFMDEEETRMATWKQKGDGTQQAEWIEDGTLPDLIRQYNQRHPGARQTLDGYINMWVVRPFVIAKGNKRGKLEMDAVVSPDNISHRRAAELTGGTVLNIESDFSAPLAELGDRIAETVAVALEPLQGNALYQKSLRVLVDGEEVPADPKDGYIYDALTHSIRFQGAAKKKAFAAKIDITYEEHL